MNAKKIFSVISTLTLMSLAAPVLASTISLNTNAKANADTQISARITALNVLQSRIDQMQKVSASQKASLDATLQSSVAAMTALKAKIDADTDSVSLKTDIQSITKSYRIYMLILPQGHITAAADRIITIAGLMTELSAKLQTRITAAQTSGNDVTALKVSLNDMNAKSADASVQATAAINEVTNLKPDNGDKTVFASNQAALKDAQAKIKLAASDLKTARQDAGSIVKALVSLHASASAKATGQ